MSHVGVLRVAELAHGQVQRGGERAAQRLAGRASSLPVPHPRRTAAERIALSSTVLPTPRSPVSTIGAFGTRPGDAFEHDVEAVELGVAAGQFGRALPGTGGVRDCGPGSTLGLYRRI